MMVLKKKQIVAVSLIVLVAAAGFISWVYAPEEQPLAVDASPSSDPVSAEEHIILYDPDTDETEDESDKTGQAQYVNGEVSGEVSGEGEQEVSAGEESGEVIDETAVGTQSYFDDARLQKETAKGKAIEMLNTLIENPSSDKEARESAQAQILNFANAQKSEAACENIIKAKGFSDCVVFINSENVTVVVKSASLSESDAAKIQEIITGQVDIDAKNVKIVEVA